MANVEHSALTGSNLHEPKGIASATVSTVYVADGVGSGSWTTLGVASLASAAKAFQGQLLHVRDEKASGTAGGTFTQGVWQTRTLNTVLTNEITSASLATNQITLPAGTYWIEAVAPCVQCGRSKAKLYNVTDASDTIIGNNGANDTTVGWVCNNTVKGRFTIAGSKVFELRHICSNTITTQGFGASVTTGLVEVYSEVLIWKVA